MYLYMHIHITCILLLLGRTPSLGEWVGGQAEVTEGVLNYLQRFFGTV